MKFYHLRHISRIGHDRGLGLHDAVKDETLNELTWKQGQTMGRSTTPPIPFLFNVLIILTNYGSAITSTEIRNKFRGQQRLEDRKLKLVIYVNICV